MKNIVLLFIAVTGLTAGCATTSPPDNTIPEIQDSDPLIVQLSATARKAFEAGDTPNAVVMYRRALTRARAMDNSVEIGRISHNLAASLISLEDWDEAAQLLAEAERETLRAGGDAGPVLLLAAELNRRRGNTSQAEAAINRLEKLALTDEVRGQAYVLRAHLACDRGDPARAEGFLARARGFLKKNQDPGLAGSISEVNGRIAMLKGNWLEAAKSYDREAAWMKQANRLTEMADALEWAGQNYAKAGKLDLATDRLYRAARSWMGQDSYLEALRVIELAQQWKEKSGEPTDDSDITRLFDEIRTSLNKSAQTVAAPEQ